MPYYRNEIGHIVCRFDEIGYYFYIFICIYVYLYVFIYIYIYFL